MGPWWSTERISYVGRLGDETAARSNGNATALARAYATWIDLVNEEPSVSLFLGPGLPPDASVVDSTGEVTAAIGEIGGRTGRWPCWSRTGAGCTSPSTEGSGSSRRGASKSATTRPASGWGGVR